MLVRPDRIVAWRQPEAASYAESELADALGRILGRDVATASTQHGVAAHPHSLQTTS